MDKAIKNYKNKPRTFCKMYYVQKLDFLQKVRGKKVVIMGLGIYEDGSGISAALFFASRGARVLVTDLKNKKDLRDQLGRLKKYKNIKYVLGCHRKEDFEKADLVFQNPSVPCHSPYLEIARKNNTPIINDWSIFFDYYDNFMIGVTGTRGKSTTTALIFDFIKTKNKNAILAGNIGVSPLKFFGKIKKESIVVAELSSWLLRGFEPVAKSPNVAVITNLLEDHLNQYKSIKDYYEDKKNIFRFQGPEDFLILNKDNTETKKLAKEAKSQIFWFSKKPFVGSNGIFVKDGKIIFYNKREKELVCQKRDIRLLGDHNLENVLAAICVAKICRISNREIGKALRNFSGLPNRLEFVGEVAGVKYYNDTTSTSPDGTIAALEALKNYRKKIVLLAGGADKGLDYGKFAKSAKNYAKAIILFNGKATEKILADLGRVKFPILCVDSMSVAVENARKFAKAGDVVLLSPGAASFGIFKNEFDRGEQFKSLLDFASPTE